MLDILYSQLARARRRYYQRRPHLRRRLEAPVISIGNLTVGGSGKTPLAAEIARVLLAMGERPAILSRGYARRHAEPGVVVVSDGTTVLSDVEHSGDEPLMLARALPGAAVLVGPSRYTSGRFAERRLGCTVHVLDDGFQHFDLMRDVDLLIAPDGSEEVRTLPFGRFREPVDAAAGADALLVEEGANLPPDLNVQPAFRFTRQLAQLPAASAFAFAGIARPQRFYDDLERGGWRLTGRRSFPDHHHYSFTDIREVNAAALASGAQVMVTTEKDVVRLQSHLHSHTSDIDGLEIVAVPLVVTVEPAFGVWLAERLRVARLR